jgi:hypothetical protein
MAEIKNNFTGGKMNKDLDDRLVPPNEYRNAINLQISKSENSDVGSLQTILGNELVVNFNALTEIENLDCIGYFVDTANNRVFLFLTDYTDTNATPQYSPMANNYIYVYNSLQSSYTKLVEGPFLNFSKNSPIIGVNLLESLLFWTDNRNQPRKINVNKANPSNLENPTYYIIEDQISVAKLSPVYSPDLYAESSIVPGEYETTMYNVTDKFLPPFGLSAVVNGSISSSNTFVIDEPEGNILPKPGQLISTLDAGPVIPNNIRVVSYDDVTFTVVVDTNITLIDNQVIEFNANPYYNPSFIGDPLYLEDKFVRFSYRYRFDDNEYSIFAPFTQITYIPRQDGYFLYEPNLEITQEPLIDDETATYRSTIVSFMYNKVNNIFLQIKLPCPADELQSVCKISEIDILYKESDGLAVQIVDIIPVSEIAAQAGSSDVYVYNYQSKKPFKTLPERDLIRVYDKTPIKALGQEIVSNRVVYSNYQDKQGYPKFLNYNVACNDKSSFNELENRTSIIEYPNHSVKQNRNYEVGIILSDKFGRQSGVILSSALDSFDANYGAASLYVPYKAETAYDSGIPEGDIVNQWPGYSLKVLFNDVISGGGITDWPGIYQGDSELPGYNPLGWYSYKVVVKQNEQDYYNVYLPGMMASYPEDPLKELDKTSHFVLIGDNINKVPRDLADVSNTQEQYRSSVKLYSRVNNIYDSLIPDFENEQFYPGNTFSFVNTIATLNSLFPNSTPPPDPPEGYYQFYQNLSNPLIARLSTATKLGVTTAEVPPITEGFVATARLAVCETSPFDSRLDLYWETSTSGIISELNQAIVEGSDAPSSIDGWTFYLPESADIGFDAVEGFYFADALGVPMSIPLADISFTVENTLGNDRTSYFSITDGPGDTFNLTTTDYFYYGPGANSSESYIFYINVETFNPPTNSLFDDKTGTLTNVAPTITEFPNEPQYYPLGDAFIFQFEGNNGSIVAGGQSQANLTWSIVGGSDYFYIDPVTGELTQPSADVPEGIYDMTIRLTDAGGLTDDVEISIRFSALYGITWEVELGGPGIVSTGAEPGGTFSAAGTITVEADFTARVRAGAFPFIWGPNDVVTQVDIFGFSPALTRAAYGGTGGGLSSAYYDLVGPGTWNFDITVSYLGTGGGEGGMFLESV